MWEEMRSSLEFLDNPFGTMPRARDPGHSSTTFALTVAAGSCLPLR